jgi:hypothetical protein
VGSGEAHVARHVIQLSMHCTSFAEWNGILDVTESICQGSVTRLLLHGIGVESALFDACSWLFVAIRFLAFAMVAERARRCLWTPTRGAGAVAEVVHTAAISNSDVRCSPCAVRLRCAWPASREGPISRLPRLNLEPIRKEAGRERIIENIYLRLHFKTAKKVA